MTDTKKRASSEHRRLQAPSKSRTRSAISVIAILFSAVTVLLGMRLGMAKVVDSNVFGEGVYINNVDVSNWTKDETKQSLGNFVEQQNDQIRVKVVIGYTEKEFNAQELGITSNVDAVIEQAFSEQNDPDKSLAENFENAINRKEGVRYYSENIVDTEVLRKNVADFVEKDSVAPKNAEAVFDPETQTFTYTESKDGMTADVDSICAELERRIRSNDFSDVQVAAAAAYPQITEEDLKANTVKIGSARSTLDSGEQARTENITLLTRLLNGLTIEPQQTLSLSELIGEPTEEKGFTQASVRPEKGSAASEIGGGISQVAGTLYAAALNAGMEIVERTNNVIPPDYLPIGLDAAFEWGETDLLVKNISAYPIYIYAGIEDGSLHINLYGSPQPNDVRMEVENEIKELIDPGTPEVTVTDELKPGESKVVRAERTGYNVEVYRRYYNGEELIDEELISEDHFPAVKESILEGEGTEEN